MSVIAGIGWHMVGAASAASFYAPIERVKKWSWETTWAVAGFFSWILLPIGISLYLLPNFQAFYAAIPTALIWKVALLGAMWGVGNVSYGLTMRHLGISLGVGVAIGVTLVAGTLVPKLIAGQYADLFLSRSGFWNISGMLVALTGIAVVSWAGHLKEIELGREAEEFNVKLGLALAVMCGIFSSGFAFALNAATPIREAALRAGVNSLYARLPSYVLIMGGGAIVNLTYCFVRLGFKRSISLRADLAQPGATLLKNASMAAAGGIMWYFQFFFYAWGEANISVRLSYVNWMLHMSGYVLFGGIVGLALGEWAGVGRRASQAALGRNANHYRRRQPGGAWTCDLR